MRLQFLLILLFLSLLFSSCNSLRTISIDARVPSEKIVPLNVKRVLVLKNIPNQPISAEHDSNISLIKESNRGVNKDSLKITIPQAFVQFVREENPSYTIQLNEENLRSDDNYIITKYIPTDSLDYYKKLNNSDLIISINNILVNSQNIIIPSKYNEQLCLVSIKMTLSASGHFFDKRETDLDVIISDSIVFKEQGYPLEYLQKSDFIGDIKKEMIKELSMTIAEKLSNTFAPHWQKEERVLFTTINSQMRRAITLFHGGNYKQAIEEWNNYFDNSKSQLTKAKAAFNMALTYEIEGDLEMACKWIEKSDSLMKVSSKNKKENIILTNRYKKRLNERKAELLKFIE